MLVNVTPFDGLGRARGVIYAGMRKVRGVIVSASHRLSGCISHGGGEGERNFMRFCCCCCFVLLLFVWLVLERWMYVNIGYSTQL